MATTNAKITLSSDITDDSLSVNNESLLYTAGTTTGANTMTSVTKVLASTNQVDLITTGSVSTTHGYVYINNPDTDNTRHFKVTIGNAGGGSPTDTEEIGRLYGGDWMFMPWDVDDDICVAPSDGNDMTVEYMVFS
jgi:hypothetical protein|tara:strand:+ start:1175 stop:1582 length:408 start_codon:yes stop_codon:yes gene_type:complete